MPCEIRGNAIICTRTRKPRPERCFYCEQDATILCDFRLENKKTCDRSTCRAHAVNIGPDIDYCFDHWKDSLI